MKQHTKPKIIYAYCGDNLITA